LSIGAIYKYGSVQVVPIEKVFRSPFQVRSRYGNIPRLAKDIEQHGLLQPILVRPVDGGFEIVHGHRRWNAIKTLEQSHISCFVKPLSDIEAIVIQGSENIQRKNYDPIEEGSLYKNYQTFMEKENAVRVGYQQIAETFSTSRSNVEAKIGLLDLPKDVQKKIIESKIPFRKVRPLITLTRNVDSSALESFKKAGQIAQPRTNKYFSEIQTLAEEIEKGSKGGLRTRQGVFDAVDAVQEGKTVEEALEDAKLKESIEIAKKQAEQGKNPKQIIKEIIESQQDPQAVLDATVKLNIENIGKLLESGTLKCPHCGGIDLLWGCCKEELVKN